MEKLEKLQPVLKLFFCSWHMDSTPWKKKRKEKEQLLSQKTGKHSFVTENFI